MKYLINSALICLVLAVAAPVFAQESFVSYTVAPGDTCTSIALEFYGDARAYNHIHDYNDLSDQGYACQPGTKLRLPVLAEQPEAQLLARTGQVRAKPPKAEWDPVDVGAGLFEAWRVNTLERARAELGFRDDSEIQMRQNTLVVIYGPTKDKAEQRVGRRAHVDRGRLKTALSGLSGSPMDVSTPDAQAHFKSGKAQVTVDAQDKESRIANHSGDAARVTAPDGSGAVSVKAGQGTRVKHGKPPEKPRDLPATPTWEDSFSPQALTFTGGRATVNASWKPVKNADAYYVEISRGRRQLDILFSKRVPATTHALQMQQLPAGRYYVSIVAIDATEFESIPSELRRLRVSKMGVNPAQVVDAKAHEFMLGAQLNAPRGMRCRVDDGAFGELVDLETVGEHQIDCKDDNNQMQMVVHAIEPQLDRLDATSTDVSVRLGEAKTVDVKFTPGLPARVRVDGGEGIALKAQKLDAQTMRVTLAPRPEAALGSSEIGFYYKDTRLGGIALEVEPKAQAGSVKTAQKEVAPEYFFSVLLGYDVVGVDSYWDEYFPLVGGSIELGFGLVPTRYFAAEARVGFSLYTENRTDMVLGARAQGMAGLFELAAAPYLGVGAGWKTWLDNTSRFELRPSLGVMPKIGDTLRLRAEVGVDLTPVSGEFKLLPEVRIGASWSF